MRLRVSEIIKENGRTIEFNFDKVNIDLSDRYKGFEIIDDVSFKGKAVNNEKIITISGIILFKYKTECCRCLKEIIKNASIDVNENIRELTGENNDEYFYDSGVTNLLKIVEDNVILEIPAKHFCTIDCKGLCPECGVNKQKGESCNCQQDEEYVNPSFNELKKLI